MALTDRVAALLSRGIYNLPKKHFELSLVNTLLLTNI